MSDARRPGNDVYSHTELSACVFISHLLRYLHPTTSQRAYTSPAWWWRRSQSWITGWYTTKGGSKGREGVATASLFPWRPSLLLFIPFLQYDPSRLHFPLILFLSTFLDMPMCTTAHLWFVLKTSKTFHFRITLKMSLSKRKNRRFFYIHYIQYFPTEWNFSDRHLNYASKTEHPQVHSSYIYRRKDIKTVNVQSDLDNVSNDAFVDIFTR